MTEPLVFHFHIGPGDRPEAMYMIDLACRCRLCKFEQFQRFYHSTPFHRLTLAGLERCADEAPLKAGYECQNCGESVGSNQVRASVVRFGFSDDSGVVRIFDDLESDRRTFELTARRRLDPQVLPRWSADPDAHRRGHHVLDDLRESDLWDILDRPFSLKLAIRDRLTSCLREEHGATFARISPDFWLAIQPDSTSAEAVARRQPEGDFTDAHNAGDLRPIELADSAPSRLPTRENPSSLPGRWPRWLPDFAVEALRQRQIRATAFVRPHAAIEIVERTLEIARLRFQRTDRDGTTRFRSLTTPTDTTFPAPIDVDEILHRAVCTGLTPGVAARLTTEEVAGHLLQLW